MTNFLSKHQICQSAKQKVRELKSRHDIEATLDEVICLHELGKLVESPVGAESRYLRGEPELAGNVWLFPFTIGASMWWKHTIQMFSESDPTSQYLLPFALHHARNPELLNTLNTSKEVRLAVKTFTKALSCTVEELDHALNRILPATDAQGEEEPGDHADWEQVVGTLCHYFKGTVPEYWLWAQSLDVSLALLAKSAKMMAADGEEFDDRDPAFRAVHNLQMAFNEIVKSREQKPDVE